MKILNTLPTQSLYCRYFFIVEKSNLPKYILSSDNKKHINIIDGFYHQYVFKIDMSDMCFDSGTLEMSTFTFLSLIKNKASLNIKSIILVDSITFDFRKEILEENICILKEVLYYLLQDFWIYNNLFTIKRICFYFHYMKSDLENNFIEFKQTFLSLNKYLLSNFTPFSDDRKKVYVEHYDYIVLKDGITHQNNLGYGSFLTTQLFEPD